HLASELNVSVGKIHSILKKNKYHPYRPNLVQHLVPGDSERRLTFVAWLLVQTQEEQRFLDYIFWIDASKFTNNGIINKQNNRYWSDSNTFWTNDTHFQHVWGTNVWCGLVGGKLLGPYFYDGTLTGIRYLDFLSNQLSIFMEDIPLNIRAHLFFQQDGAPAHNALIVHKYLEQAINHRWVLVGQ
ncbi:uncharacterized protein LOC112688013, partial [Sipha flava]|uniref:Uncharacterized protein LOC112688013 n=1 Tax=Sipha flava TaxID=143950 RepID=A0A8B8G0P5_9HEMI